MRPRLTSPIAGLLVIALLIIAAGVGPHDPWPADELRYALPSLVARLGILWLVYDLGKRLWNRQTRLLAAAVLEDWSASRRWNG